MTARGRSTERGQALILIVLGMVVLLGFTALAVDGSMVYSDRRYAQNGTDASSLAGGGEAALLMENNNVRYDGWDCSSSMINSVVKPAAIAAAISRAADNDFSIDEIAGNGDQGIVTVTCGVDSAPAGDDKYLDVRTEITNDTQTSFAHFVYKGVMRNTVEAVTRVRPRTPFMFGHAIVGLNPAPCSGNSNGVVFTGDIDVDVNGGGIFSNGCLRGDGNSLDVDVTNGDINYAGQLYATHPTTFDPVPSSSGPLDESEFQIDPPRCDLVPNYGSPSSAFAVNASGYIPAGNYTQINANGALILQGGGLFCLYGNFDTGNVNVSIVPMGALDGVTIYLVSGSFTTGGGGSVYLKAPGWEPDPFPAIPGLLIYLAEGNTGLVKLRGNSTSYYSGTVYAPDGNIDIAGTAGATTFNNQLIAKNVFVGGNVDLDVNFESANAYWMPTRLELYR